MATPADATVAGGPAAATLPSDPAAAALQRERFGEDRLILGLADEPTCLTDPDGLEWLVDHVERANGGPAAGGVTIVWIVTPPPPHLSRSSQRSIRRP